MSTDVGNKSWQNARVVAIPSDVLENLESDQPDESARARSRDLKEPRRERTTKRRSDGDDDGDERRNLTDLEKDVLLKDGSEGKDGVDGRSHRDFGGVCERRRGSGLISGGGGREEEGMGDVHKLRCVQNHFSASLT